MEKHHKEAFDRIPSKKREKILSVAVEEFANNGYNNANVNTIAKKANVSVGSLYKYFDAKEDIFLTVVHMGISLLGSTLDSILNSEDDFFTKIEKIIRVIQEHSRKDSDIIKLYNGMTSEGSVELVKKISIEMEGVSFACYSVLVNQAQKEGIIGSDIDARFLSFFLDNLFLILQFSYGTDYYQERMKVYLGDDIFDKDEELLKYALLFLRKGFL